MEKEKVLLFEIISTNDVGMIGRLKQNTDVLKRGKDTEYSRGYIYPCWDIINKRLYTYGDDEYDDLIFTVPQDDIALFSNKIDKINEKYGIPKRWRAEEGGIYYFINLESSVSKERDFDHSDYCRYELGNYFKTKEDAEKVLNSKEYKDFWAKVRAGEIGRDDN